jgi:hypothetical protein
MGMQFDPRAWPASGPPPGLARCQACGRTAHTKHVRFMQNIGALIVRFPRQVEGSLCRHCIDKYFFEMTGITLVLGWWGVISFVYSLVAVPVNLFGYVGALSLPAPPDDVPSLLAKKKRAAILIAIGVLLLAGGLAAVPWSHDPDAGALGAPSFVLPSILLTVALLMLGFGATRFAAARSKLTVT